MFSDFDGFPVFALLFGIIGTFGLFGMAMILRQRKQLFVPRKSVPLTKISDDSSHPVSAEYFPVYYDSLIQNEERIKEEFVELGKKGADVALPTVVGSMPENRWKNRYVNILPCVYLYLLYNPHKTKKPRGPIPFRVVF